MAKFSTNAYTRTVLVNNLNKLPTEAFKSAKVLASALSPRAGSKSAQFFSLRKFVNLNRIFRTSKSPVDVKNAILSILTSSSRRVSSTRSSTSSSRTRTSTVSGRNSTSNGSASNSSKNSSQYSN